jgi:hypothetical protein
LLFAAAAVATIAALAVYVFPTRTWLDQRAALAETSVDLRELEAERSERASLEARSVELGIRAEELGRSIADAVLKLVGQDQARFRPITGALSTVARYVALPLEPAPSRDLLRSFVEDRNVFRRRFADSMLRLADQGRMPQAVPLPIQVLRFGTDLVLVAIGGEITVEYALRIKRELGAEYAWVAGYAKEVPCYIPSEKVLTESG